MSDQISNIQTLEQQRAKQAWSAVDYIVKKHNSVSGKYKSAVKSAPAYVISNGLAQTLAFYGSKQKDVHYQKLKEQISTWVCLRLDEKGAELSELLRDRDSAFLRLATQEALAYLQWLRRFADAQILKDEEN